MVRERLLSQLAHVEITTPTPDASLEFFADVLGLEVSGRRGESVYLRGWSEWFHHSLQLTEGSAPALGHIGWRVEGPGQLELAVARLEASGLGEGWHEDELGHGRAYRYRSPNGQHLHEIFWEVDRYQVPAELASTYPNRPQRYEGRGVGVRYLDHVTINTRDLWGDAEWYRDTLGHRIMEYTTPTTPTSSSSRCCPSASAGTTSGSSRTRRQTAAVSTISPSGSTSARTCARRPTTCSSEASRSSSARAGTG